MEWRDKYNPMNSDKGLTFYEHYKKILAWMDGNGKLPAPIEASLDPTTACNSRCYYCSSNQYLNAKSERWHNEYMEDLFADLCQWGVKAFCWGGREATMNPYLAEGTRLGVMCGLEAAIVTNGVHLPDDLLDALMLCKWIGVSVDTTSPEIYKQVRGTDDCETVWKNIRRLARKKDKTVLGVRALILPETVATLYDVCYQARESGANFCHIRPADLERKDLEMGKVEFNTGDVYAVLDKCHDLETESFGVFTIGHKFTQDFHVKHDFKRCLASPLVVQICADKKKYLCVDHRMDPRYEVKEWGSDQHRELIKSIDPGKECSRCTWAGYNSICEKVVLEDRMHVHFP